LKSTIEMRPIGSKPHGFVLATSQLFQCKGIP
jgi:hypothetical protein